MPTGAMIGYGNLYEVSHNGGASWVTIGETVDITPPNITVGEESVTHTRSPNATIETIPTMIDPGSMNFGINWVPGSATEVEILDSIAAREVLLHRVTYPNGVIWTWSGFFTAFEPEAPNEGKLAASVTVRAKNMRVLTPAAAPTNTVLPAVSGIAQVGETLTALEGVWTGAPNFTYQWQEDDSGWANIVGATGKTYDPVVGNVGNPLRVIVTGTNAAGNASATSQPTADVLAE
jgi:hypothetical protein